MIKKKEELMGFGQAFEFFLKLSGADLTPNLAQRVIESKENQLAKDIVHLIQQGGLRFLNFQEPEIWQEARRIMKDNFIGVFEGMKHFPEVPMRVWDNFPDLDIEKYKKDLEECKSTHILVAYPGSFTLQKIRKKYYDLFYTAAKCWYGNRGFAEKTRMPSWWLIRKNVLSDSTSKTWEEQKMLISQNEMVPEANILAYGIVGYYREKGIRLFEHIYARTNNLDSDGCPVRLGHFSSGGLIVRYHQNDGCSDEYSGISTARELV